MNYPPRKVLLTLCLWSTIFFTLNIVIISWKSYTIPTTAGDTGDYFRPVEYLIKQGSYWWDYRMPGYGLVYGALLKITGSKPLSEMGMTFLALTLVIGALFASMRYIYEQTESLWATHAVGFVWSTAGIAHRWVVLLPDTTVAATNVLTIILLLKRNFLLGGFLLTYMTFSRPVSGVLLLVTALFIGLAYPRWKDRGRNWLLAFLPFLLAETAWVTRNFIRYGDFRPLHGTNTLYHATTDEPLWTAFRMFQVLGLSGDSRALFMLWGGWPVDTQVFFAIIPQKHLSDANKKDLIQLLFTVEALKTTSDSKANCMLQDSITRLGQKVAKEVRISPTARRLWRVYQALFTDMFYFASSTSPLQWIPHLFRHPLYAWNSLSFLMYLLLSTIGLWCYLSCVPASLKPIGLLWYGFGIGVPLAHVLLDFALEQRYLNIYTPTLGIAMVFLFSKKGKNPPLS